MEEIPNSQSQQSDQAIQNICRLLLSTFTAQSGSDQKRAEDELTHYLEKDANFIKNLLLIVSNSSITDQIRESACLFINTSLRVLVNDKLCTVEQKIQWSELFMDALKEPSIPLKNKMKLSYSLNMVISSTKNNDIRISVFTKILEWISVQERQFSTASLIGLQVVISSVSETQYLYKIFDSIEFGFCEIANFFAIPLQTLLKQKVADMHPPNLTNSVLQSISESLGLLNLWARTLKKIIKQFSSSSSQSHILLMQKILTNENIAKVVFQLLELNAYQGSQVQSNEFLSSCLVSISGCIEIDEGLNELKTTLLQNVIQLLDFSFAKRPKISVDGNFYFKMLEVLIPKVLNSLYNFCNQQKHRSTMSLHTTIDSSEFIDKLLTQQLVLLANSGTQIDFYKIFQQNMVSIITDIIFPLASSSNSELEMMVESPEDFVSLQEDCCHKQVLIYLNISFNTFMHYPTNINNTKQERFECKVKAFYLLEMMVDQIDGAMYSISTFAIDLAQYAINCQSPNEIDKRFPSIVCFKEGVFLNTFSKEIILETALMIISCIYYNIEEREGLIESLQALIKDNLYSLCNPSLSNIVKCRFAHFMSKYYDKIFWNAEDVPAYEQCVMQVFSYLGCTDELSRSVQLSAIESLDNIYFDEEYSQRLISTIHPAIDILIQYLPNIDIPVYLDLIFSITQKFSSVLKDNQEALSKIINGLIEKMIVENKKIVSQESKTAIVLNKGMSILKGICENNNYVPRYINMIEQKLQELAQNIESSIDGNFDDELLAILVSLMKHSNGITGLVKTMLPLFPTYFAKKQGVLSNLFQLLNYVFVHGVEHLKQNPSILASLLEICLRSMFATSSNSVYCSEADRAQGPILLQIIIQSLGGSFSVEFWQTITSQITDRLKRTDIKNSFFRNRLLGVLLMSLASSFEDVQRILEGDLELILKLVTNNPNKIGTNYDRRIFIMTISQILQQDPNTYSNQLKIYIPALLDTIITLLNRQKKEEEKNLAQLQAKQRSKQERSISEKSKQTTRYDGSEDESNDDWNSDSSDSDTQKKGKQSSSDDEIDFRNNLSVAKEEILEDQLTLKSLLNPFTSTDEFAYFKQRVLSIKHRDPMYFQQLVSSLAKPKIESLSTLLSIERVMTNISSDGKTITQSIPRKIIKVKRKLGAATKFECEQ